MLGCQRLVARAAIITAIVAYTFQIKELGDMVRERVVAIDRYSKAIFTYSVHPFVFMQALAGPGRNV